MKTSKLLILGMFIMSLGITVPAMAAAPTFTGDVPADFVGPEILTILDPGGVGDVGLPGSAPPGTVSGWDMVGFRLTYDSSSGILYVGINAAGIGGDADGDGFPGVTAAWLAGVGGTDHPDLSSSESFAVYFDLDQNGTYDVIAGVSGLIDITGFSVNNFTGSEFNPAYAFGTALPGNTGAVYASPSVTAPDLEFTITNFSTLPGQDALLGGFKVTAFMGSQSDDGIGEDFITYEQSPSTIVDISSSAITDGTVDLTVTEYNDGDVPLTDVEVVVNDGSTDIATLDENTAIESMTDDNILEVGETWTWNASTDAALNDIAIGAGKTFTATGSGTDPAGFVVTHPGDPEEQDEVTVVPEPCIEITKTVDCEVSKVGDTVNYHYCIHNCGPLELEITDITDSVVDDAEVMAAFMDAHAGDVTLDPDEQVCFDVAYEILPEDDDYELVNEVVVYAEDTSYAQAVQDDDTETVTLVHPSLSVTKSCINENQEVEPGGIAIFEIEVENTGDVCLEVEIIDLDADRMIGCGPYTLDPDQTETCQVEIDVPSDTTAVEIWNNVTAHWTICVPPRSEDPPCLQNEGDEPASAKCDVPGGATRTPGFWKTHYNYTEHILIDMIPDCLGGPCIDLGWIEVCDMDEVCAVFWANKSNNTDGSKRSKLCQARMHASFHALAAIFNNCMPSGGGIPVDPAEIAAILGGDDIGAIKDLASILADYNESGDDIAIIDPWGPPGSATPSDCKSVDMDFADCINGTASTSSQGQGKNK